MPAPLDPGEPDRVADAVAKLGLAHVVVTSVDRDDLPTAAPAHFARTIGAIRAASSSDDDRSADAGFFAQGRRAGDRRRGRPDVFNHNLETVPWNYPTVRPGARYFHSLRLLQRAKELDPTSSRSRASWSGSARSGARSLRSWTTCAAAEVDFLTIGQYLQPSRKHHEVMDFITPEEFKAYETIGAPRASLLVAASPLTRSSHHAGEDFERLRNKRAAAKSQTGSD